MTAKEFSIKARNGRLYEKAKSTLCAFSDGSIFIDGNLDKLEEDAKSSGLLFFVLKDNREKKEEPKSKKAE